MRSRSGTPRGGAYALGVSPIKFVTNRPQMPLLELPDGDATPAVGRPDHRRVHELQDRAPAERVRDNLGAPPLFREEALDHRRPQLAGRRPERSPRGAASPRPATPPRRRRGPRIADVGPLAVRRLAPQISQLVGQPPVPPGDAWFGCQARVHSRLVIQQL